MLPDAINWLRKRNLIPLEDKLAGHDDLTPPMEEPSGGGAALSLEKPDMPAPLPALPAVETPEIAGKDALAIAMSGIGDAFNASAGRTTSTAKDTSELIQQAPALAAARKKAARDAKELSEMDSPGSMVSKFHQDLAAKYTGKPVTEFANASASQLGKVFPTIEKAWQAELERKSAESVAADRLKSQEAQAKDSLALRQQMASDSNDIKSLLLKSQLDEKAQKREEKEKGRVVPGFESDGSVIVDDTEAKNLRDGVGEFKSFREGLNEYRDLIEQYGTGELMGRGSAELGAASKNLQLKIKKLAQLGVLSASDIPFMEKQVPDPSLFRLKSGMHGALDQTDKNMTTTVLNNMASRGYKPTAEMLRMLGGEGTAKPAPGAGAGGEVERIGRDGKVSIFDATTKQFLRYK